MLKGTTNHGFTVIRTQPLPELDAVMYLMRHERTGLELVWIKRSEVNRTFGIAFPTLPEDDTGVFHILEHSVLCGSEKYQVKEPFVELMKTSMNTFLNAMTFPDKTYYPISSRNPKDFLNLMRVYLDAVFRPMIYSKSEIFRQEGWHYELSGDGKLIRKGVVYNEMRGAFADADELEENAMMRALYPDTPYRFVSGGDPEHIPELTYEKFLDYHRRFYSPSNAYVYLDGDVDIDAVLGIIDGEYLSSFEPGERLPVPALQRPVHAPEQRVVYELPTEEDERDRFRLAWGRVLGEITDRERMTAMQVLCTVLCGNNQSVLTREMLAAGLGEAVSMMVWDGCAQPFVKLEVRNVTEDNIAPAGEKLRAVLTGLAENGLDRDELEAAMANLEFQMRERDYGYYPQGLGISFNVLDSWLRGGEPEALVEVGGLFDALRAKMAEGYFEELIRSVLLNNPHACEIVMVPSHSVGEERRERDVKELERIAASWSEADRETVKSQQAALDAWQGTADRPEALAALPRLEIADISPEPEEYPTRTDSLDGVTLLRHELPTSGISYVSLYFDITGLGGEDIAAVNFLGELLGKVDTATHTAQELNRLIQLYCGNMSFSVDVYERSAEEYCAKFTARVSAIESKIGKALELLGEVLTASRLDSEKEVTDILRQRRTSMMQQLMNNGHVSAIGRVSSQLAAGSAANEWANGYDYYCWLKRQNAALDFGALSDTLATLASRVIGRRGLTVSVTGMHSGAVDEAVSALLAVVPEGEGVSGPGVAPRGVRREGIEIPSDVGYAAMGALSGEFDGLWQLAGRVISLEYLWNAVRVQGGAYGTGMVTRVSGFDGCYSYRDPSAAGTLETYAGVPRFLRDFAANAADIDGLITGAISAGEPLLTPRAKGEEADDLYFRGITHEMRRTRRAQMLNSKSADLSGIADSLERIFTHPGVSVLAQRTELERCSLDEILSL